MRSWRLAEKIVGCISYLLLVVSVAPFVWQGIVQAAQTQGAEQLRGRVVFADGTPAAEATVKASAICSERIDGDVHIDLSQERMTAEDGTFSFPVFDPDCNRYRLSASKPADFWLPSNENVFSDLPPTAPVVDVSATMSPQQVEIALRIRGGKAVFRVWDIATGRFVRANLNLTRKAMRSKVFGSMLLATGMDGSANTQLLPPGEYTVEVESYPCGKEQYWTSRRLGNSFIVKPAAQLEETIRIDVRNIKPLPRYDGRELGNCRP